jgi:hypothetical protein
VDVDQIAAGEQGQKAERLARGLEREHDRSQEHPNQRVDARVDA